MGVFAGPEIIENGLVLALDAGNTKSYPGSGTTWTDLSGRGNNGTLTNGPTYSNGAIVFDGVDDYAQFGGSSRYFTNYITQQIAIEIWIYVPSSAVWSNGNYANILSRGSFGGSHGLFKTSTDNQISAWFRQTGSFVTGGQVQSTGLITRDAWYQLVAIWKAPGSALYINGSLSSENNIALVDINATATDDLWNMGLNTAATGAAGNYFGGRIANTKIYNRALTAAEIQQNYNATKSRFGL